MSEPKQFRVMGRGEFPADMLRYDACYPADSQSAGKISCPSPLEGEAAYHTFRQNVRVITLRTMGRGCPTFARWSSFGWSVINPDVYPNWETNEQIEADINQGKRPAIVGAIAVTDLSRETMDMLRTILRRLDMEPAEAIFPCSAMREDIRKLLAQATDGQDATT